MTVVVLVTVTGSKKKCYLGWQMAPSLSQLITPDAMELMPLFICGDGIQSHRLILPGNASATRKKTMVKLLSLFKSKYFMLLISVVVIFVPLVSTLFSGWYVVAVWCGAFISGFVIFSEFISSLSFKHGWHQRLFDCGIGTISGVCLWIAIWVGWHFIGWVSPPIAGLGFIAFPLFRKTIKYWGALWTR
ncbi:hypothetical protein RSF51_000832 [Yersinia enterocolitica]|uniref:Uncharacterized protein n=2 Tax=Yersinia enterocolitica TaxID=630 RepID=A0A0H5G499_YEREN|nr:hypothetical protein [Yersinia enterocolitica]EKN3412796.1 hypothetical protein [Yersinia enterocolitica]EKN3495194.1 hypothetical protein [Yersinia enterocolitica]EKN3508001.1 hypothetical protein [Yersinia enterocolitica]EKN3556341.1 hypothetical protein [Yersinia enterocolitica]